MGYLFDKNNRFVPTSLKGWYKFHFVTVFGQKRNASNPRTEMFKKYSSEGDVIMNLVRMKDNLHKVMRQATMKQIQELYQSNDFQDFEYGQKLHLALIEEDKNLYGKELSNLLDSSQKLNEEYSKSIKYCERQYWFTFTTFSITVFSAIGFYFFWAVT